MRKAGRGLRRKWLNEERGNRRRREGLKQCDKEIIKGRL